MLEGSKGRDERALLLFLWNRRVKISSFNVGYLVIRLQRYIFTALLQAVMFGGEPRVRTRLGVPGFFLVAAWRGPLFDRGVKALVGLAPWRPRV